MCYLPAEVLGGGPSPVPYRGDGTGLRAQLDGTR